MNRCSTLAVKCHIGDSLNTTSENVSTTSARTLRQLRRRHQLLLEITAARAPVSIRESATPCDRRRAPGPDNARGHGSGHDGEADALACYGDSAYGTVGARDAIGKAGHHAVIKFEPLRSRSFERGASPRRRWGVADGNGRHAMLARTWGRPVR